MTDATPAAGTPAADPYLRWETLGGWSAQPDQRTLERERLESRAKGTDATSQLLRCFPRWTRALEQLTWRALDAARRQRAGRPQRPRRWRSRDAHAQAVLRRHGTRQVSADAADLGGDPALIDGQARGRPRRRPRLDAPSPRPASALDERAARARTRALPIDLDDPAVCAYRDDQRRALAAPARARRRAGRRPLALGCSPPRRLRRRATCAAGGSPRPPGCALADEQLPAVGTVERPVGVFVAPARARATGWQLTPVLSLDAIRLIAALGGRVERDLRSARAARSAPSSELLERDQRRTRCTPGRASAWTPPASSRRSSRASSARRVSPGVPREQARPLGPAARPPPRLHRRATAREHAELALRVVTFAGARVHRSAGSASAPRDEHARAAERGDGARRGGADRDRARAAAAALHRGRRPAQGHACASGA